MEPVTEELCVFFMWLLQLFNLLINAGLLGLLAGS